jgi:DNA-binding CsgD family transcriptional regulator
MNIINQFLNITSPDQFSTLNLESHIPFPFHLYWKDRDGKYLANNDTQAQHSGYRESRDLIGLTDYDLAWSTSAPSLRNNDMKVMKLRSPETFLESGMLQDNFMVYSFSAKIPLLTKSMKADGMLGLSLIFTLEQFPEFLMLLLSGQNNSYISMEIFSLTQRQLDCVYYLILGMTLKEIGCALHLSHKTVEHYLNNIKDKLKCKSRTELIKKALKHPYIRNKLF